MSRAWRTILCIAVLLLSGCNRDRTNDSMAPRGATESPRPVGTDDVTVRRGTTAAAATRLEVAPALPEGAAGGGASGVANSAGTRITADAGSGGMAGRAGSAVR
jgi:hypothetical protein